jgi:hypothetical protein
MRIYISSSWKNRDRVRAFANAARSRGITVYDFTDARCRRTEEIPPEKFPEQFDPERHVYAKYLSRPEWRQAVMENMFALQRVDVVVLLLPCGIDATADWAYAIGRGVLSVVVGHPPAGERSPVHLWATKMVETDEEALRWLVAKRAAENC